MRLPAILIVLLINVAVRVWRFWFENTGLTIGRLSNPDEANYLTYARELLAQGPSWFLMERSLSAPPGQAIYLAATGGSVRGQRRDRYRDRHLPGRRSTRRDTPA